MKWGVRIFALVLGMLILINVPLTYGQETRAGPVNIETDETYTLEYASLNQGMIMEYDWESDDEYDKVDFWIEDGSGNKYKESDNIASASDTFTIPSDGTYTIKWFNDNWMDTVTFTYDINILNPPAVDDLSLSVTKSFSENPCHQGNTSIMTVIVKNTNEDQIKVMSVGVHMDFFPENYYLTEDGLDKTLATDQEFSVDLEIEVATDVSLGTHIYDIYIEYQGRVLGNWYETSWQSAEMSDFTVIEIDRDFDGHPDSLDTFPDNPNEWKDTDSDGTGDNSDKFPNDPAAFKDTDDDGFPDAWILGKTESDSTTGLKLDAFPDDAAASKDDDGDGYPTSWNTGKTESDSTTGLKLDAFPNDPAASSDPDGDGYPDTWNTGKSEADSTTGLKLDAFPNDPTEWMDTDGDGVGDNADRFKDDPAASVDTDNDGYPDVWNDGKTEKDSTTGLKIDDFPGDPTKWKKEEKAPFLEIMGILVAAILAAVLVTKKKR